MHKELFIGITSFDGHELKSERIIRPWPVGEINLEECRWHYQCNEIRKNS